MGCEVHCKCWWADQTGAVKALLESDEIIVRGDIKRRVRLADISRHQVVGCAHWNMSTRKLPRYLLH